MKGCGLRVVGVGLLLAVVVCVGGAPSNMNGDDSTGGRLISPKSVLGRNRVRSGDVDPQTRNDLRILSLFENELNKIFSCYIRLSCPRTRSPEAVAECEEIKDWPLYHQVMRMSGIKRYPYQRYASQRQPLGANTNQALEDEGESHRVRRHHRRHRRNHVEQMES